MTEPTDPAAEISTKHIWRGMLARCNDPRSTGFRNYGARGIKVCARWKSYENFRADMGKRPAGRSIDRINNDGNYEPGNCRWATAKQQCRNRRGNRIVRVGEQTKTASEWAEISGVPVNTFLRRIALGWSEERLLKSSMHQRLQTHCKRGHEFTPENTMKSHRGKARQCRICDRARKKTIVDRRRKGLRNEVANLKAALESAERDARVKDLFHGINGHGIRDAEEHADHIIRQLLWGMRVDESNQGLVRKYLIEHFTAAEARALTAERRLETARAALEKIERWDMPVSGHFWDKDKKEPMSYGAAFGSNGERDHIKSVAAEALAALQPQDAPTAKDTEPHG